ncbi:MAG: hypothetical protein KAR11_03970 [Phycisphaerae bacterium]|nr:hypothetical protein [Phycisphaerae bacterium]
MNQASLQISPTRWVVLLGLSAAAIGLLLFLGLGEGYAQGQTATVTPDSKIFVTVGRISRETYGLYLVDYENKTICIYQVTPEKGRSLKLISARSYKYDVQLDAYNTPDEMSPAVVKEMVERRK